MKNKFLSIFIGVMVAVATSSLVFGKTNTIINNVVTIDKSLITNASNDDIITIHHNLVTTNSTGVDFISSFVLKPEDKNLQIKEVSYPQYKVERAYDIMFVPNNDPRIYSKKVSTVLVFTEANYEKSSFFHTNTPVLRTDTGLAIIEIHSTNKNYTNLQSPDGKRFLELLKSTKTNIYPYQLSNTNGVKGINADFTFKLQNGYELLAYNDKFNDSSNALSKINFYPTTPKSYETPQLLFSLYVFDVNNYTPSDEYNVIKTTDKYIFAIKAKVTNDYRIRLNQLRFEKYKNFYGGNGFQNITKAIDTGEISLQSKIDKANIANKLKSTPAIVVPKFIAPVKKSINDTVSSTVTTKAPITATLTQTVNEAVSRKLFINGKDSGINYITNKDGINYLPIRATLEKLGFIVEWNASTKTISYHNSKATGLITIDSKDYFYIRDKITLDYAPVKIDSSSYMPIEWLAGVMPYNYIIKSNGDLYLTIE